MPSILKTSLAIISLLAAGASHAQQAGTAASEQATPTTATPPPPRQPGRRIEIGRSTYDLLAVQRASQGLRPRPIDGEQAGRSYERYLKSFETEIPERFETGLGVKKR